MRATYTSTAPREMARTSRAMTVTIGIPRRSNHPRASSPWLARAVGAVMCVVATSSARAASPVPEPPLDLGQTSFLDGEAGPGGLLEIIGNGYVASQFRDASGRPVAGANQQSIGTVIFHFAYLSDVPFAGGVLGAETLIPLSILHLDVPGTPQTTEGGLGDVTVAPFIQWTKLPVWQRPLSIRLAIQVTAPTGQYSANDPINAGSDAWQVSPYLAFTWRLSDRWEISGRSIYDWSGQSARPPVSLGAANSQAGAQFAQNLSVSAAITDNWRIGMAGYALWQLGDTRVDGHAVPGSRQQVIALGPGLLWSDGHTTVIANVFEEIEARNRPRGTSAVLRLLHPL
jgi:hypothetical protein